MVDLAQEAVGMGDMLGILTEEGEEALIRSALITDEWSEETITLLMPLLLKICGPFEGEELEPEDDFKAFGYSPSDDHYPRRNQVLGFE
jgi:hypothetical protein